MGLRWNWAAGAMVGLAALTLQLAVPSIQSTVRFGSWGDLDSSVWLLYAGAALAVLGTLALVTRVPAVVSVLGFLSAGTFIAGVAIQTNHWDISRTSTVYSISLIAGAAILGLGVTAGLRRV